MGWFNKIFKGSNQRFRVGNDHYYGNYPNDGPSADTDADHDESHTQEPSTSEDTSNDQENEEIDRAIALSLLQENQEQTSSVSGKYPTVDEDEQLARALQESMAVGNSPHYKNGSAYDNGNAYGTGDLYGNGHIYGGGGNVYANGDIYYPRPITFQTDFRICAGCNMEIGHGRFLNCLNSLWHPECFRCYGCSQPISEYEFSTSGNYPFHKACYRERYHPKCDVCSHFGTSFLGSEVLPFSRT